MLRFALILGMGLWALPSFTARAQLPAQGLFARTNLVAWCIVPFDSQKRGPEERAAMLDRLGVKRLAYDWRAEHIPTFDAEVAALQKHGIELTAWWFPANLNDEAKAILACLERHHLSPQLWVTLGTEPETDPVKLAQKISGAVETLTPICNAAARLGSTVALYNHLGWFGEPTNQIEVIQKLWAAGHTNVGSVYNFHHAHAHIDDFPQQLKLLQPYLLAINLNGMIANGDQIGKKIIPLGTGSEELRMLQTLQASDWNGPVGIIGHTEEDAELKLQKELKGLEKLAPQINQAPSPTPVRPSASTLPNPAAAAASAGGARTTGEPGASGREPASQVEKDWIDNRWQETDVGPFLASNLRLPDGSVIAKALTVKVGGEGKGAVVYDTETMNLRAAWTGGFLNFDPARFGLTGAVRPDGAVLFISHKSKDAAGPNLKFKGFHSGLQGPVMEYQANGVRILEHADLRQTPAGFVFIRNFWVGPHNENLTLLAAGHLRGTNQGSHSITEQQVHTSVNANPAGNSTVERTQEERNRLLLWNDEGNIRSGAGISGTAIRKSESYVDSEGGRELVTLEASDLPTVFSIFLWRGPINEWSHFEQFMEGAEPGGNPQVLAHAGPARWPIFTTRGQRGLDTDFLAVDTLTLPYDNPSKALLFASGVDFTPDGAGYICTLHGDVWRVTGIDDSLQNLQWQRYATGLFQPLGLKVRDGKVFVLGRDRITRLHDENGDGEADFYESFFDGIQTSTGGHDYVTCLEQDDTGNFYYVDPQGVHRVAADGSRMDTLATGFRNPNGLGVSPDGQVITVAPQQGTWTPSSLIAEIKPGGYYGYGGPKITDSRPLGYDASLCWIPHSVDNSSGSQVWVPPGQWGPLGGQMLHLLWGRCGMMLVLRDTDRIAGGLARANPPAHQGAVVPLPAKFLSGPNRGTFNPHDGALYIAGSTGWQTSAVKDGSLQRVRFTGQRVALPVGFHVRPGGLDVTFSQPLDRATAEDPGSYGLKEWNYRYAEAYGSKDWSVANPEREGRDDVAVKSAHLGSEGRTVFLEIPDLKPVMQLELRYNVDPAKAGKPLRGTLWLTVNEGA